MARFLVVANRMLGGEALLARLSQAAAEGPCEIHVPVTASADPTQAFHDETVDRKVARRRLDEALSRFTELDATISGEVGDHRPVDAVGDVLRREHSAGHLSPRQRWRGGRSQDPLLAAVVREPSTASEGRPSSHDRDRAELDSMAG